MDQILLIVAGLSLVGLTILWIVQPLVRGMEAGGERTAEARAAAELSAQHDMVLKSLRDLDNDYAAGKLADDDYEAQRQTVLAEGVVLLQKMDALKASLATTDPTLDREIEAAVAARRAVLAPADGAGPTCPSCGAQVRPNARFCDQCGATLQAASAASPISPSRMS